LNCEIGLVYGLGLTLGKHTLSGLSSFANRLSKKPETKEPEVFGLGFVVG
jgi:hypothetical protein